MNLWPGILSLDLAAKYCSMKPVEFKRAVAIGDLPQPVLIDGKERNAEMGKCGITFLFALTSDAESFTALFMGIDPALAGESR